MYGVSGNLTAVGEIKCPVGQAKIEELRFLKVIDEKTEYYWQFLGHFIGKPEVDTLYYVIYDGYQNDGRILEMHRADHAENIAKLAERIKLADTVIETSIKLDKDFKECLPIAQQILPIRLEIEELKPRAKGNVPVQNQITRLKKQIKKLYINKAA